MAVSETIGGLPGSAAAPKREGLRYQMRKSSPLGIAYGVIVFLFYFLVFVIPFCVAIWLSFQNWDYLTTPRFVGFRNYAKMFTSDYFWAALKTTAIFSVSEIVIALFLALLLGLMLSRMKGKWEALFLTIYYLPMVTPGVVSVFLWRWMYRPRGGVFNNILTSLGLPEQPFLNSGKQALWCIIAMVIWTYVGQASVILLAGIKDISVSIFDAAKVDGAGFWQTFFRITLPLLRPVLVYQLVSSVIGTVQMFDVFFLMSGPGFSTRTLALYNYQLGFTSLNLGFGAAVSMFMFVLLLFATVFQLRRFQITWEY